MISKSKPKFELLQKKESKLLAQGFKPKYFEIQTMDNLDSNKEFKLRIWKID
jgi:hypothetical protein